MTDIISSGLIILRILAAFLLVLIIPGFALVYVFFPRTLDIPPLDRLVLSCIVSIGTVIVGALVMDYVLGLDTTPTNIVLFLVVVTGLSLICWRLELVLMAKSAGMGMTTGISRLSASCQNIVRDVTVSTNALGKKISDQFKGRLP